jgi:nicotinamidase-related amidase
MRDLAGRTPALLVIDSQMEVAVDAGGALGASGFEEAIDRIADLLQAARAATLPVIFTQEFHRKEMVDFGRELDGAEPVHCLEGTPGVELHPRTRPAQGEWLIQKRRYSAFFGTDLDVLLHGLRADTLLVCGFLADVCVHYSCVDAHQRDYFIHVARDATVGSDPVAAEASLGAIEYLQRGSVVRSDEVRGAIEALTRARLAQPAVLATG